MELVIDFVSELCSMTGLLILIPIGTAIVLLVIYPILRALWNWSLTWFD